MSSAKQVREISAILEAMRDLDRYLPAQAIRPSVAKEFQRANDAEFFAGWRNSPSRACSRNGQTTTGVRPSGSSVEPALSSAQGAAPIPVVAVGHASWGGSSLASTLCIVESSLAMNAPAADHESWASRPPLASPQARPWAIRFRRSTCAW